MVRNIGIRPPSKNRQNSTRSSAEKAPTIKGSSTRKAIIYSRTRVWIGRQLMLLPQPCACQKPGSHFSRAWLVHPREHEPGDESRRADEHGEGIMIKVAGLQSHDIACDIEYAGGYAVGAKAVDQPAVAALP